ncbi:phage tail tape measure protein [Chitinophaga sp. SYP-B3965]|uniref:phage tail tape measure protein n=1 Tax=Chitinophaga sp. SYP-B3965 TaxID=2663120 RepID=UPI001565DDEB|nr:phage tail tape measure protein [Chitinophaga sp. SYP-B3965]
MEDAEQAATGIGEAITQTSTRAGALSREIEEMSRALEQYRQRMATANDPEEIRAMQSVMERYERQIQDVTRELQELERAPDPARTRQNWSAIMLAANQTWELTQKVMESFDFASEIKNLESNVARYTGLTGEALDSIVAKASRIGEVFDEDAGDIVRAANAMTKQMGGTFEENLNLIQSGFEKGANLNGDMLDQLTEYGPQLKAAGLDAAQGLAIMANAAKDGIFSDKALDAIKEANLSLREMGQPQVDALAAIGIQVKDLAGKTSYEAMQMIAKGMKGATTQARQMVVADLFRGAGEDAGLSFIEGMDTVDLDLNKIPSVKQAGESTKGFLSDLKTSFSSMFGEIATNAQAMGGIVQMVGGLIPIVQALSRVQFIANAATRVATAAQWLWNLALSNNPIGYVVLAIAALVGGIVWAWKNFQSFREVVYGVWAAIEAVFGGMGGFVGEVLEGILHLLKGVFNPANWFDENYNFSDGLAKIGEAAAKYGETVGSAFKDGVKKGGESFAEDQKAEQEQEAGLSVNDAATGGDKSTLDGTYNLGGNKGGKGGKGGKGSGKDGSGLNIDGGGASGGKSITMNLEIKNYFQNVSSKLDTRKIADEIFSQVNDRLRDSLIAGG